MSDEATPNVADLVDALRELLEAWGADSIAIVLDTSFGKVRLTVCVGMPLVIEDMQGNALVGDVLR